MRIERFESRVVLGLALAVAAGPACVPQGNAVVGPSSAGALRVITAFGDTTGHLGGSVSAVAISADGRTGAIGGEGVEIFEIPSLRRLAFLPELNAQDGALALSPDGSLVVARGLRAADVEIWNVREHRRLVATRAPWRVSAAAFSSRGGLLAVGGEGLGIALWDLTRGRWIWRKAEPVAGSVKSLQFSDDDRLLLSATQVLIASGEDWFRSPRVWEVATATQVATLAQAISPAAWTNDARFVIGGGIGNAQVWDRASGRPIAVLPHFDASLVRREPRIYGVALSPDGARAYTAGEYGALAIWDVATQTEIHRIAAHQDTVMALAVSRDGRYALTGGRDKQGHLWDLRSFQEVAQGAGHRAAVTALAVSADGRELYSVSPDGRALAWALPAGQAVGDGVGWDHWPPAAALWGIPRNISVCLARHGTVVVGSEGNHAFAVDRASGRILWERDLTRTRLLTVGPASDHLQAFSDFSPIVVDLDTGETRFRIQTQQGGVLAVSSGCPRITVRGSETR